MRSTDESRFPTRPAKRVTMALATRDHVRHGSLMVKILQRARNAGLAGATVLEAQEGYGTSGHAHRAHLLSNDAPVTIVLVDQPDRIDAFLDGNEDLLRGVLVTVSDVDVVEL